MKKKFEKKSHKTEKGDRKLPKKLKRGTLWDFSTSVLSENSNKLKGDPLGKNFFRIKSLTEPKSMKK